MRSPDVALVGTWLPTADLSHSSSSPWLAHRTFCPQQFHLFFIYLSLCFCVSTISPISLSLTVVSPSAAFSVCLHHFDLVCGSGKLADVPNKRKKKHISWQVIVVLFSKNNKYTPGYLFQPVYITNKDFSRIRQTVTCRKFNNQLFGIRLFTLSFTFKLIENTGMTWKNVK